MSFKITDHVEFSSGGRAVCPSCERDGKGKKQNLSLIPDGDGAYKCHRGCTPEDIREALGIQKSQLVPASQAPKVPPKRTQLNPQKVKAQHTKLIESDGLAKKWLTNRGLTEEIISRHQLGISQVKIGSSRPWAISIPMVSDGGTAYYSKKRVAPWDSNVTDRPDYMAWKQYGIPQRVWFTHQPKDPQETWLCEGEWDAMLLGDLALRSGKPIAVACFTCGCGAVPPKEQLDKLPGQVTIFYDLNDEPLKNGKIPGRDGAEKCAAALGDRGRIGSVPMPTGCTIKGWDISDAINSGAYTFDDFTAAASSAIKYVAKASSDNTLRQALIWNDEMVDAAPDYIEWLVPDLLTEDELFMLAAGPRAGKSLLAMSLAMAVATGGQFLGRPCTQGTVIYVACEDNSTKLKERQAAQGWGRGLPVAWLGDFKLGKMAELEELVAELDPRLLVLDTLSRIKDAGISESSAEMSQLLEPLQKMASKYGCCVLLVHHTGKVSADNADKIDIFDTIRGSSAIRAVCRGSMVLAAGDRNYRLVVENGWGKHDLKVVLDTNTLTWQQLGKWSPPVNESQQDQIIAALKKLGKASVEQIHEETGIPKRSLYEQVSRLVNSDIAGLKLKKEGTRRNYTYQLALVNTSQQLTSVLTSGNPHGESNRPSSQQNTFFTGNSSAPQFSTGENVPVENAENFAKGVPPTNTHSVDYNQPTPYTEVDSTSQQLVNSSQLRTQISPPVGMDDLSNDVPVSFEVGAEVRYVGENLTRKKMCGRKKLTIESVTEGYASVSCRQWRVHHSYPVAELAIAK